MAEKLKIQLYEKQWQFHSATAKRRGFVGGIGTGKSFVGAFDMLAKVVSGPENRLYGIYSPTYKLLSDATLRSFLAIARPWIVGHNQSDGLITLAGNREIICRSTENPENNRGPNMSGAWLDEASLMVRAAYDIIIGRLREAGEYGWLSATYTPKGRGHWTYDVFGRGDESGSFQVRAKIEDNPFLSREFIASMRNSYTSSFAQQELDGEYVDQGGAAAKREWFKIIDAGTMAGTFVRAWDFAATTKSTSDYTVGSLMSRYGGRTQIHDVKRERIAAGEIPSFVKSVAEADRARLGNLPYFVAWEQEKGSGGPMASGSLIRDLAQFIVVPIPVSGDKITRAMPFLGQAEHGNVDIVRGLWNREWLAEMDTWPNGDHKDQGDSAAHGYNALVSRPVDSLSVGNTIPNWEAE